MVRIVDAADARFLARLPSEADLGVRLEALLAFGPRFSGSPGETRAREHLAGLLASWGLGVRSQPVEVRTYERGRTEIRLHAPGGPAPLDGLARAYAPATDGVLRRPLAVAGDGSEEAFGRLGDIGGRIVYVSRTDRKAYARALERGAAAYLEPCGGPCDAMRTACMPPGGGGPDVPLVRLRPSSARQLEAVAAAHPGVDVSLRVTGETRPAVSANLEARLPGSDPDAGELWVGAHLDTFCLGPGPVDNTSGVLALAELARMLSGIGPLPRTMRFLLFTAEEQGKVGSGRYVEEAFSDPARAGAYFNFDVPVGGVPDFHVMAGEDPDLDYWRSFALRTGEIFCHQALWRRSSDHYPFYRAGVPCLMLRAKARTPSEETGFLIHTERDAAGRLNLAELRDAVRLSGRILLRLALEPSLPFGTFAPRPDEPRFYDETQ